MYGVISGHLLADSGVFLAASKAAGFRNCMVMTFVKLYSCFTVLMTLTLFQGHSNVTDGQQKFFFLFWSG